MQVTEDPDLWYYIANKNVLPNVPNYLSSKDKVHSNGLQWKQNDWVSLTNSNAPTRFLQELDAYIPGTLPWCFTSFFTYLEWSSVKFDLVPYRKVLNVLWATYLITRHLGTGHFIQYSLLWVILFRCIKWPSIFSHGHFTPDMALS